VNRESWLLALTEELRPRFAEVGAPLPAEPRLSCGWPSRGATAARNRVIGECWGAKHSADRHPEVFISPALADGVEVAAVVVHELIHAAGQMGHGAGFRRVAVALGLTGPMTATAAGETLRAELAEIVSELGPYPHGALSWGERERKQTTRLLKVMCGYCGYTVRVTARWLGVGFPVCPCGYMMEPADREEGV
jgi:hypothetical protein